MRIIGCAIAPLALIVAWAQTVTSPQDSTKDSLYALRTQAMKAYTDKHYGEAVRLFDAAFSAGLNRDEDAYNAACSAALAGNRLKALEYLNQAARLGHRDADHMLSDADLQSVCTPTANFNVLSNARGKTKSHTGVSMATSGVPPSLQLTCGPILESL